MYGIFTWIWTRENKESTRMKPKRSYSFLDNMSNYSISSGYIYPVFGAFRALLKFRKESEEVEWIFDPIEIWNEVGSSIIQNTFESNNNPQLAGNDKQLWLSNYRIVETQSLRKQLRNH